MRRLAALGLLVPLPKTGATNGPQPSARSGPDAWHALQALIGRVAGLPPA